ncbi:MAG TPA: transposase, partial [Thermoanaerobaculia bacterium]|nr:transposase [Thermoanaerobaculia bacterium]
GGIVKNLDGKSLRVGGVTDHVHMVVGLRSTHCLSEFMRDVKSSSSAWVHKRPRNKGFAWQVGYGGFTVSKSNLDAVIEYVVNQEEHHRRRSFQEEYRELLEKNEIKFDERYLW